MSKLLKEIDVPKEVRTIESVCPSKIKIFDDYISFEGERSSSYFYKDFTGVSTQNASILCAYASIIFLNPVSANQTWKNDFPVLTDMNRVLFCSGLFSYKKANNYVKDLAQIIKEVIENYKKGNNLENTNDTIEELKKYKELLDTGVITQDDFNEKKKQLLNL